MLISVNEHWSCKILHALTPPLGGVFYYSNIHVLPSEILC